MVLAYEVVMKALRRPAIFVFPALGVKSQNVRVVGI
jgi:hypothetical protein